MEKLAQRANRVRIFLQNCQSIPNHRLHTAELLGAAGNVCNLILSDIGGVPRESSKKQHYRLHQLATAIAGENDWINLEITNRRKCNMIEPAERRPQLILAADCLF